MKPTVALPNRALALLCLLCSFVWSGSLVAAPDFERTEQREPCRDYNASEAAFYYVRVLENPSCRWSTLHCQAARVNPFDTSCSEQAAAKNAIMKDQGAIGDGLYQLLPEPGRATLLFSHLARASVDFTHLD